MASADQRKQKVLKAKKTMPTSCRKQLEILNKSENVEVLKTGHNQKKRTFSANKENVKRMKTSEQINGNACVALERRTALLEQVKYYIQQEIHRINFKLFDKMNELSERILKAQCRSKHEALAGELFVKIRNLQRRIKTVLLAQENYLESKASPDSTVCKAFGSFKHLPPLPEPPAPFPPLTDKIRDTLPPQKPELRVKWVLRPLGIALLWNVLKVNPKCAPVESYHLFLCCEDSDHLTWKKIGEIKALPLPMACTLSQFFSSNKYYFTVQSKDIFGRYGPFCDVKCITGFSENLT